MVACLQWRQGIAAMLSSLLYFKQKYVAHNLYLRHPENLSLSRSLQPLSLTPSQDATPISSTQLTLLNRALIYPSHVPTDSRNDVPRPSQYGMTDFEDLMIPTPDNETLSAFYIRAPKTLSKRKITVLMFHGNAGNIGHRVPIARMFIQSMGCSVFMLEYRGYGLSTGSPDEQGLMIDAQTAYDYIRRRAETRDNEIVVFGQSLGGAVAVQLVARNQGDPKLVGLVLENTFLSMRKLIPSYVSPSPRSSFHQLYSPKLLLRTDNLIA